MQIDRVFKGTVSLVGDAILHTVKNGRLNGLFISGYVPGESDDDIITVKLLDKFQSPTAIHRLPLKMFAQLSDWRFGAGVIYAGNSPKLFNYLRNVTATIQNYVQLLDSITNYGLDIDFTSTDELLSDWASYAGMDEIGEKNAGLGGGIFIPLGSLTLKDQEIEVTIESKSAGVKREYTISRYISTIKQEHLLHYDITRDMESDLKGCEELWMMRADYSMFDKTDKENEISLEIAGERHQNFNVYESLKVTNSIGRIEGVGCSSITRLASSTNGMPLTGTVEMDGDLNLYKFLLIRRLYDERKTDSASKEVVRDKLTRIEKLQENDPELTKEMQKANVLPTVAEVRMEKEIVDPA